MLNTVWAMTKTLAIDKCSISINQFITHIHIMTTMFMFHFEFQFLSISYPFHNLHQRLRTWPTTYMRQWLILNVSHFIIDKHTSCINISTDKHTSCIHISTDMHISYINTSNDKHMSCINTSKDKRKSCINTLSDKHMSCISGVHPLSPPTQHPV